MQNVLEVPRARFKNGADWKLLKQMDLLHPTLQNLMNDQERLVAYRQMIRASKENRQVIQFRRYPNVK